MGKMIAGVAVALVVAASASGATIAGVAVWKIALAAVGAAIFVMGGTSSRRAR